MNKEDILRQIQQTIDDAVSRQKHGDDPNLNLQDTIEYLKMILEKEDATL